jgi:hypothetical protein
MRRALLLLFAAALLAGCGGDTASLDPIAQAADKTREAKSARFTLRAEIRDPTEGVLAFSGPGAFTDRGQSMRMRMTVNATADTPKTVFEMLLVGETYYMRSPLFGVLLPSGKRWVKFTDPNGAVLSGLGQNDPAQVLEFLRATGDVDEVGTETIRGVETTHYKAEVEIEKVADRASPEQRPRVERLIDAIKSAGIEKIPLEVWVGDDDLVRRMKMDWTFSNPDKPSERASIKFTMDLFDFGADVSVEAPPASHVADLPGGLMEEGRG